MVAITSKSGLKTTNQLWASNESDTAYMVQFEVFSYQKTKFKFKWLMSPSVSACIMSTKSGVDNVIAFEWTREGLKFYSKNKTRCLNGV